MPLWQQELDHIQQRCVRTCVALPSSLERADIPAALQLLTTLLRDHSGRTGMPNVQVHAREQAGRVGMMDVNKVKSSLYIWQRRKNLLPSITNSPTEPAQARSLSSHFAPYNHIPIHGAENTTRRSAPSPLYLIPNALSASALPRTRYPRRLCPIIQNMQRKWVTELSRKLFVVSSNLASKLGWILSISHRRDSTGDRIPFLYV